jgi:hypothetical protein
MKGDLVVFWGVEHGLRVSPQPPPSGHGTPTRNRTHLKLKLGTYLIAVNESIARFQIYESGKELQGLNPFAVR